MGWAGPLFLIIGILLMGAASVLRIEVSGIDAKTNSMIAGGALFVGGAVFMGARHVGETIATLIAHMRTNPALSAADVPLPADMTAKPSLSDEQSARVGSVTMAAIEKRKTARNMVVLTVVLIALVAAALLYWSQRGGAATAPATGRESAAGAAQGN
jgi:hypothetical protein